MNVPLKGSIQVRTSASARLDIWMEEEIRIIKIIICILTCFIVLIYVLYFDIIIQSIGWISVCVVLLLLVLDALFPKNRVIDLLSKISQNWFNLLTIVFILNLILPIDESHIRYISYLLSFFWITFGLQRWFEKELKNSNIESYKSYLVMVLNLFFIIGFVCFCLFISTLLPS